MDSTETTLFHFGKASYKTSIVSLKKYKVVLLNIYNEQKKKQEKKRSSYVSQNSGQTMIFSGTKSFCTGVLDVKHQNERN